MAHSFEKFRDICKADNESFDEKKIICFSCFVEGGKILGDFDYYYMECSINELIQKIYATEEQVDIIEPSDYTTEFKNINDFDLRFEIHNSTKYWIYVRFYNMSVRDYIPVPDDEDIFNPRSGTKINNFCDIIDLFNWK